VWKIMQSHVGIDNRILRPNLVVHACGRWSETNDRKVRDVIADLPIISTSKGDGGYWLPASDKEINDYESEMLSRVASIRQKVQFTRKWLKANRQPERAVQPQLLEVA
jgi:hypothetical protein